MLLEQNADLVPVPDLTLPVSVSIGPGASVHVDRDSDGLVVLTIDGEPGQEVRVLLSVPLGNAEGYWTPGVGLPHLIPDWAGRQTCQLTSSNPLGCLYDDAGSAMLAFATDTMVAECNLQYGVSEEHKVFVVSYKGHLRAGNPLRVALLEKPARLSEAVPLLRAWQGTFLPLSPRPVPESARTPVYSTWYAFTQDIDAAIVEADAEIGASLGCRTVFIDDGWQEGASGRGYAGCGQWRADQAKFPDFAAHIERLHDLGQEVVVWIAPLLLGLDSPVHEKLAPFAPHLNETDRMRTLDPRYAVCREHIVNTCLSIIDNYGADGLKIDFLDTSAVYANTESEGDIDDVGEAMCQALAELRAGLEQRGLADALIEFRQSYVGPGMSQFGNVIRAGDCPADAVLNRYSTINTRMMAGPQVVHADPIMWDPTGGPVSVARQMLGAYFGVPQLSMPLGGVPDPQRKTITHLLGHWQRTREIVLDGLFDGGIPTHNYPVVRAWLPEADGDRGVIGVYADSLVDLADQRFTELTLLNSTPRAALTLRVPSPQRFHLQATEPTGQVTHDGEIELSGLAELPVPVGGVAVLRQSA